MRDSLVVQGLLALAVVTLVLGVLDFVQTREDQDPPVVTTVPAPLTGWGQRYVKHESRLDPDTAILCRVRKGGLLAGFPFALVPYPRGSNSRQMIVHVTIPEPETPEGSRPRISVPGTTGPRFGLLRPFPQDLEPVDPSRPVPRGSSIAVFDDTVEPPTETVPFLFILLGGVAAYLLTCGPDEESSKDDEPGEGPWKPVHRVEPSSADALQYLGLTAMLVALAVVPRFLRVGGPHLYDSVVLTLLYAVGAGLAGATAFRKATNGAILSCAGIRLPSGPPGGRSVAWDDVTAMHREQPESGSEDSIELVLAAKGGRTVRLALGRGEHAGRVAADVASCVTATLYADLRERVIRGATLEFGDLRVEHLALSWPEERRRRQVDFPDLQRIRIADGVLSFRLIAVEWDAYSCHYQELPNGFVLPRLLAELVSKSGSPCHLDWVETGLTGRDAWLAPARASGALGAGPGEDTEALLGRAFDAQVAGRIDEAVELHRQVLAGLETGRARLTPGMALSLEALGCLCLARGDVSAACGLLDRLVPGGSAPEGCDADLPARALHNRAVAAVRAGLATEALELAASSLKLYRALPAPHPVHVARASNTLAGLLVQTERAEEGANLVDEAIASLERLVGSGPVAIDPDVVVSLVYNRASLLDDRFDREARHGLYVRAAELCRAACGVPSLAAAQAQASLGLFHLTSKNPTAALTALEEALGMYEAVLGEGHSRTGECLIWIGEAFWGAREAARARQIWEMSVPIIAQAVTDPARGRHLQAVRAAIEKRIGPVTAPAAAAAGAVEAALALPLFGEPGPWRMVCSALPPSREPGPAQVG